MAFFRSIFHIKVCKNLRRFQSTSGNTVIGGSFAKKGSLGLSTFSLRHFWAQNKICKLKFANKKKFALKSTNMSVGIPSVDSGFNDTGKYKFSYIAKIMSNCNKDQILLIWKSIFKKENTENKSYFFFFQMYPHLFLRGNLMMWMMMK